MNSVALRVLQPLLHSLKDSGHDSRGLLIDAGVPEADLGKPALRVSESTVARICNLAAESNADPGFMLQAGMSSSPANLGVLGYVMQNAATLRESWDYLQRYWRLLHDEPLFSIDEDADVAVLRLRPDPAAEPESRRALIEYLMAFVLRLSGHLIGGLERGAGFLQGIDFRHARPDDELMQQYKAVFRTHELRFGCSHNAVKFSYAMLDQPVSSADAELLAIMERRAEAELEQSRNASSITAKVRAVIHQYLPGRAPGLPEVAEACLMSRATLQRRLAAEGGSFSELLDGERHALADEMLKEGISGIGEIAFALGYADTAAFHHAYKRWTGRTPGQAD